MSRKYKDKEWLKTQYHSKGKTQPQIAEECGVTATTISDWMDRHDIPRRDNVEAQLVNSPLDDNEWLREEYCEKGKSMRDIADEVGATPSGVKKALDRIGVETRGAHDSQRKEPASHYWDQKGYEQVASKYDYERDGTTVHQLVVIAEGANPSKVFSNGRYHVHHKNGVKWDNRPENLELQSSKTHVVHHHHDNKRSVPAEYNTDKDKEEILFELRQVIVDWRESDSSTMEVCADELDGLLRET